jgi:hypothetical protein
MRLMDCITLDKVTLPCRNTLLVDTIMHSDMPLKIRCAWLLPSLKYVLCRKYFKVVTIWTTRQVAGGSTIEQPPKARSYSSFIDYFLEGKASTPYFSMGVMSCVVQRSNNNTAFALKVQYKQVSGYS